MLDLQLLSAAAGGSAEAQKKLNELQAAFDAGVAASKAGNFDESIASFEKAAALAPNCYDCYYNIGYAQFQKKDYEKSEAAYKKATEIKPDYVDAWNALSNVYNVQKKLDEALAASNKAAELASAAPAVLAPRAAVAAMQVRSTIRASSSGTSRNTPRPRTSSRRPRRPIRSTREAFYLLGMAYVNLGGHAEGGDCVRGLSGRRPEREARRGGQEVHRRDEEVVPDRPGAGRRCPDCRPAPPRAAARAAGREPSAIRLVAVSKTFPPEAVREAAAAGQVDFGENKVQEGLQKIAATSDLPLRWHLIGHLQSNKARRAAAQLPRHSLDRQPGPAPARGRRPPRTPEPRRSSWCRWILPARRPSSAPRRLDVPALFEAPLRAARLVGLMLLPPWTENPEDARSWFRRLRELRDELAARGIPPDRLRELSMGMSHDFEVAVQEGSTLVRIGTAIFGARAPHARQEDTG